MFVRFVVPLMILAIAGFYGVAEWRRLCTSEHISRIEALRALLKDSRKDSRK